MHITFVLLPSALQLDAARICASYSTLFPSETLACSQDEAGASLQLKTSGGADVLASLVPAAISTGEVEAAAERSGSVFSGVAADTKHGAHVVVTSAGSFGSRADPRASTFGSRADPRASTFGSRADPRASTPPRKSLSLVQHSKVVAAIAYAHGARAIYDGQAHATFPSEFFLDLIREELFMLLWTGISFADENPGRGSFLTLGLDRFGVSNLLVSAPTSRLDFAYQLLLDMAEYVVSRGEDIAHGDTIGRNPTEIFRVTHERSPARDGKTVMRIDVSESSTPPPASA